MSRAHRMTALVAVLALVGCIAEERPQGERPRGQNERGSSDVIPPPAPPGDGKGQGVGEPLTAEDWDRLVAAAGKDLRLVEADLKVGATDSGYGGFDITMLLPEGVKTEWSAGGLIITKGKEFAIHVVAGVGDFEEKKRLAEHHGGLVVADNLVVTRDQILDTRGYEFAYWARFGYVDICVENLGSLDGSLISHTSDQCLLMLKCARSVALKNKLPDDPVAALKQLDARAVERDGKVVELRLQSVSTTRSTIALVQGLTDLEVLDLYSVDVTDKEMAHLAGLTDLRRLNLAHTRITDAGLKHLAGLTHLESLDLRSHLGWPEIHGPGLEHVKSLTGLKELILGGTYVGDDALATLRELRSLEVLDLYRTRVTDAGLSHLEGLLHLKDLRLGGLRITDSGLAHLAKLAGLEELSLAETGITDAGLAHLEGLSKLQGLWLGRTKVTDAGVRRLKGLSDLRILRLDGTGVTDAVVETLRALPKLESVGLTDTKVTETGARSLRQAKPDLTIYASFRL